MQTRELKKRSLFAAIAFGLIFLLIHHKTSYECKAVSPVIKKKYIGCSVLEAGGLGNQLWRFASLYGIGMYTERVPYFAVDNFQTRFTNTELHLVNLTEIAEIFPLLHETLHIQNPPEHMVKHINFAFDCCIYESPESMRNYTEQHIQINGNYLQSYKYFMNYTTAIKQLLTCAAPVVANVNGFADDLFQNNTSYKLCVHIRRNDFLTDIMLESKSEFVIPVIDLIHEYHLRQNHQNLSLIFLGDDLKFQRDLKFNKKKFKNISYINFGNRGEDMCFGINICDSMILTASGSTFGWWMAYLMKNNGPVFYNSQVTDYGNHSKDHYYFDLFPPEWIRFEVSDGFAKFM